MSIYGYLVGGWLILIGAFGIVRSRNLIHSVVCLSIAQSGTYVLLLSVGFVNGGQAPIFADIPSTSVVVDPVVQALTLTDVVVEATVMALLLALIVQAKKRFGNVDPDTVDRMHG